MLFRIENVNGKLDVKEGYTEKAASELRIAEKDIENGLAGRPDLLFPNEQVLVVAQSVSGQSMADILAVDTDGNLVIVEIKRDWSDRSTVAQLLEYASQYQDMSFEQLANLYSSYEPMKGTNLLDKFREFSERPDADKEGFARRQRVFVVAPNSDEGLKRIIKWLQRYGVPIDFVPFRLLADSKNTLSMIDIEGVKTDIATLISDAAGDRAGDTWAGHWLFNTNERYGPGAYKRMFEHNVIAVYNYPNQGANLQGSSAGEKVFAYVNEKGIMALGRVLDPDVKPGEGIFVDEHDKQQPEEYHVRVEWKVRLPESDALSNADASRMGYPLPVRRVFAKLNRGRLATKIESEVMRRAERTGTL